MSARGLFRLAVLLAFPAATIASPQSAQQSARAAVPSAQRQFATPEAALAALVQATSTFDLDALKQILGPDGDAIVSSGDSVSDKNAAAAFAAKAQQKNQVTVDPKNANRAIISVGDDDWPLPIPLKKTSGQWYFDTKAGRQEILFRRIGANELDAIDICRGYVGAQYEYAFRPSEGFGVNQYAQRIISTPGKQDGQAWQNPDGTWAGPIGEKIARAIEQGYSPGAEPYHGYFFKILKGQGPAAPLGQMDYVVKGVMIGGFGLVAAPAEYGETGVKSFIVSQDGVVYEKDFGPDTLSEFTKMERFNPDKSWNPLADKDE